MVLHTQVHAASGAAHTNTHVALGSCKPGCTTHPQAQGTTWRRRAMQQQWGCSSSDGAVPGASSCSQHEAGCGDPGPRQGGFGFHCGPPALHSCFPKGLPAARGREAPSMCSCPIADVSPRLLAQGQSRDRWRCPSHPPIATSSPTSQPDGSPGPHPPGSSHSRGGCWGKAQR